MRVQVAGPAQPALAFVDVRPVLWTPTSHAARALLIEAGLAAFDVRCPRLCGPRAAALLPAASAVRSHSAPWDTHAGMHLACALGLMPQRHVASVRRQAAWDWVDVSPAEALGTSGHAVAWYALSPERHERVLCLLMQLVSAPSVMAGDAGLLRALFEVAGTRLLLDSGALESPDAACARATTLAKGWLKRPGFQSSLVPWGAFAAMQAGFGNHAAALKVRRLLVI
jgi:hypothetical protein